LTRASASSSSVQRARPAGGLEQAVATRKIPHTTPFIISIDETFDVGVDTRTGAEDKDYQVSFRFTGKLEKLTFKLAPVQLTSDEHQVIKHARVGANN
jgi:hypothetical protein